MAELTLEQMINEAGAALRGQGFTDHDADALAREFAEAEAAGVRTHGFSKLVSMNLGDLAADPVETSIGAITVVDGRGANGFLLFRRLAQTVAHQALESGLAAAFVRNFSRYSSLYPYTEAIANQGLVGILMNSAGPSAVAPHGVVDPITGTNPISFSFPVTNGVQTLDFSTSDVVWGAIRQAALENRPLPSGPFIDAAGSMTTDPAEVNAVRAFGGAKGSALNLAIEILCGAVVGAPMGKHVESEYDCGAVLLAIQPALTGADTSFRQTVDNLFSDVRDARPTNGGQAHAPGDRRRARAHQDLGTTVQIPDVTVDLLQRMAAGERVSELSSNPLFN